MQEMIVKDVDLMGSTVMAAKDSNGIIWVGIKWMCQGMGMTEGQYKRQIKNIKKDLLLKNSGSNLTLNKGSGEREVFCIKNDYLPIWLAKISITPTMRKENPDLADKLLDYQLEAKDILAEAFLPKQEPPTSVAGQIQLLAQGNVELNKRVDDIQADLESLKMDLPILPIEADRITEAVKKKGVSVMGGKDSNAYRNRSIVNKVYRDIYRQIYRNFEVSSYKALKRNQCDTVIEIVRKYELPIVLKDQIEQANAQQNLNLEGGE